MTLPYAHPQLRREVGLFGAVMLGLGSILGTGVFVALPLKTAEAGLWIIPAIVIAGLVALCNALSSAQLAAAHPVAGGTYEYGYRFLKPWLGFTAGWTFLLAKSASAATAALGIRFYLENNPAVLHDARPLALIGVAGVGVACLLGLRRSTAINVVLVSVTLCGLLAFIATQGTAKWVVTHGAQPGREAGFSVGAFEFSQLIAWSFVAFTGYGRLATLAEEVVDPRRTIPRAIVVTLIASVALYVGVAWAFERNYVFNRDYVHHVTVFNLSHFFSSNLVGLGRLVSLAAVTAMLGVLLNLILGLSRVWLAMARRGDAPAFLARIHEPTSTPRPAVILTGFVIALLVLVGDVRLTWSFSAFTVLIYYAITNWAALKLPPEHRLYPRWIAWCGLIACASLAWFVEWRVWAVGVAVILVGLAWHAFRRRSVVAADETQMGRS